MKVTLNKFFLISIYVFMLISIFTIILNPLIIDDAAMYALAVKNNILFNTWLAPVLTPGDISSYLDKPPLGIWILSILPKFFGVSVVTIHLTNVFVFILLLGVLYRFLLKEANKDVAVFSVMVAITSTVLVIFSRTPKLDIMIALTLMISHFELFKFIKYKRIRHAYFFTIFCAIGFLIKSGFALIFPFMTIASLYFYKDIREMLTRVLFSRHGLFNVLLFLIIILVVLVIQKPYFGGLWLEYIKSMTITSKYNTSYLGVTFNLSVLLMLGLAVFPWTGCIKIKFKSIKEGFNLYTFTLLWLLSNTIFIIFFYKQTDVRTYVMLSVPLIIFIAFNFSEIIRFNKKDIMFFIINCFLGIIFLIISIILISKNDSLFNIPLSFSLALFVLALFYIKPTKKLFLIFFCLVSLSFSLLFLQTRELVNRNNPFLQYPQIINQYKKENYNFVIFRPADRPTRMSNDHTYIDFMEGPADMYVWEYSKMENIINNQRIILILDPKSFEKLKNKNKLEIIDMNRDSVLVVSKIDIKTK